ncbi:MAG: UPF0175 family protein [Exilibacterium sp.]
MLSLQRHAVTPSLGARLRHPCRKRSLEGQHRESFFLTKNGATLYYAIPVDQVLMDHGSRLAIAFNLYKNKALTIGQAAKLAELSVEEFMVEAGKAGIPVIDYDDDVPDSEISV